jgi:hypothetical protein
MPATDLSLEGGSPDAVWADRAEGKGPEDFQAQVAPTLQQPLTCGGVATSPTVEATR